MGCSVEGGERVRVSVELAGEEPFKPVAVKPEHVGDLFRVGVEEPGDPGRVGGYTGNALFDAGQLLRFDADNECRLIDGHAADLTSGLHGGCDHTGGWRGGLLEDFAQQPCDLVETTRHRRCEVAQVAGDTVDDPVDRLTAVRHGRLDHVVRLVGGDAEIPGELCKPVVRLRHAAFNPVVRRRGDPQLFRDGRLRQPLGVAMIR